jgi:hypothetical protein
LDNLQDRRNSIKRPVLQGASDKRKSAFNLKDMLKGGQTQETRENSQKRTARLSKLNTTKKLSILSLNDIPVLPPIARTCKNK